MERCKKKNRMKKSRIQTHKQKLQNIRPNMLHRLTLQTPNFGSSRQIVREPGDLPRSTDAKRRVPSSRGSMMKLMWKGLKMHLSHGCYILAWNKTGLKWMGKSPASLFKTQSQVFFVCFFSFYYFLRRLCFDCLMAPLPLSACLEDTAVLEVFAG